MNQVDRMMAALEPDINKKCEEIKEARREKVLARFFVLLSIALVTIPTLLIFFGISLVSLVVPTTLITVAFLLLSPILMNQQGGSSYEQTKYIYRKA